MKKLISLVCSFIIFSTFAVKADTVVGVKIGHGTLDAEDVGTVNNQKGSEDASSPYGAIFVEKIDEMLLRMGIGQTSIIFRRNMVKQKKCKSETKNKPKNICEK